MKHFIAALFVNIVVFSCFNAPNLYAQDPIDGFTVFSSSHSDRFAIKIPSNWEQKKMDSVDNGIYYNFWDGQGNALSVGVRMPNTFFNLLKAIENKAVSKDQLLRFQKEFADAAPMKRGLSLSINVIANRRALTQTFLYKKETLGNVLYIINVTHEFLYNNKQYGISYSMVGKTVDKVIQNFEDSERRYFTPMLLSFSLY